MSVWTLIKHLPTRQGSPFSEEPTKLKIKNPENIKLQCCFEYTLSLIGVFKSKYHEIADTEAFLTIQYLCLTYLGEKSDNYNDIPGKPMALGRSMKT